MDSDVIAHGNFDFSGTQLIQINEDGSVEYNLGKRIVLIYVIHKNFLNNAEMMQELNKNKN